MGNEGFLFGEVGTGRGVGGIEGVFCPSKATEDSFVKRMENETWWLEDKPFLLGFGNSSGVNSLINFGRV